MYPEYIKNTYNSTIKRHTTQLKSDHRVWIDLSPKKTHKWPTDRSKDTQCHASSGKCKLKPLWDSPSQALE